MALRELAVHVPRKTALRASLSCSTSIGSASVGRQTTSPETSAAERSLDHLLRLEQQESSTSMVTSPAPARRSAAAMPCCVERSATRTSPVFRQLRSQGQLFQALAPALDQDDVDAIPRQPPGEFPADAGGRAGHERDGVGLHVVQAGPKRSFRQAQRAAGCFPPSNPARRFKCFQKIMPRAGFCSAAS
jgi:hypothetical protein